MLQSYNILISQAAWPWPQAVETIFQPAGVNALVADTIGDMVQLVDQNRVHMAIIDIGMDELSGMKALRILRKHDEQMPCILLANNSDRYLLAEVLSLNAFSVIAKPFEMSVLAQQVNRVFTKIYNSDLFRL